MTEGYTLWRIIHNSLATDNGLREIEYFQGDAGSNKQINIEEIKNPETDLKCNRETFVELYEIFPNYHTLSEKIWMENCEELSIYGEKSVLSGYERHLKPYFAPKISYSQRYFLMVFDKGSTRILLHYKHQLEDSLANKEGLSKSEIIKVVESMQPINSNDLKK